MREIKFRGLNRSSNEWKYGYLIVSEKYTQIWQENDVPVPVDPETVGQYIGRKDKGNVEIYEGDLLRVPGSSTVEEVKWNDNIWTDKDGQAVGFGGFFFTLDQYERIGNKYENPELMEKK